MIRTANKSAQRELDSGEKERTVYSNKEQAAIGKYITENRNASAQKHFKKNFTELGESTVCSFKQKYLSLVASGKSSIISILTKKMGSLWWLET